MGYGSQESNEARTGAVRKAYKAQPVTGSVDDAGTVVQRPHEPPGERLRRRRRLHLHGAVPAATKSKSLRRSPPRL